MFSQLNVPSHRTVLASNKGNAGHKDSLGANIDKAYLCNRLENKASDRLIT